MNAAAAACAQLHLPASPRLHEKRAPRLREAAAGAPSAPVDAPACSTRLNLCSRAALTAALPLVGATTTAAAVADTAAVAAAASAAIAAAAVINLLRAPSVDEYIAQGKTAGIADHNERRLRQAGRAQLRQVFEGILAME
jgi:hypothetical protein